MREMLEVLLVRYGTHISGRLELQIENVFLTHITTTQITATASETKNKLLLISEGDRLRYQNVNGRTIHYSPGPWETKIGYLCELYDQE